MSKPNVRLAAAVLACFEPIASLLLRQGIDAKSAIELLKEAYVRVAVKEYGKRGRPASSTRISDLARLSRKEVTKIRDGLTDTSALSDLLGADEADILSHWYRTDKFLDDQGEPRSLTFGPGPGSFAELINESIGSDAALQYMSKLSRFECIFVDDHGKISIHRRDWHVGNDLPQLLAEAVSSLLSTIQENWGIDRKDGLCQRVVYSTEIDPKKVDIARRISRERVTTFMEELDDYYSGLSSDDDEPFFDRDGNELVRLGVGAYYFEMEK